MFEVNGMIDNMPMEEITGRKVTPIIFMLDVSSSMSGTKIDQVNTSMEEIMSDLSRFSNSDAEVRYTVLSFCDYCKWETGENGLIPCDGVWKRLDTHGCTAFNEACSVLKERMSSKKQDGLFKFASGRTITPPIIVLMTDGYPTDGDEDGVMGINKLLENRYFRGSYRVAIAIGTDANKKLCENFTGDKELVYEVYNAKALGMILKAVIKNSVVVSSSGVSKITGGNIMLDETKPDTSVLKDTIQESIKDLEIDDNDDWD